MGEEGDHVRAKTVVVAFMVMAQLIPVGPAGAQVMPPQVALAPSQAPRDLDLPLSIADIVERARPSVVDIMVEDGRGSGVAVEQGIVTNWHVVRGFETARLTMHDGAKMDATVVRVDPGYDLALLHTEVAVPALLLEPVAAQRQGDPVIVLGYPGLGDTRLSTGGPTLSRGVITAVHNDEASGSVIVQTDAPIREGNSGGALLNGRGRLVGIPTFFSGDSPGLGFAIASDSIQAFLDGRPSKQPDEPDFSKMLILAAELGPDYTGDFEQTGPRGGWEGVVTADALTGPRIVQIITDAGDAAAARAAADALVEEAIADKEWTELRMAITAGKRVFVRYDDDAQDIAIVLAKGRYTLTVVLDFVGLPDDGKRTESAIGLADAILQRIPG
jgi:S1-C subfamily serine protease